VRARGTAAHKLIELTPLDGLGRSLPATLETIRRAEGLTAVAGPDVLEWVSRFWRSRYGVALGALGATRVHRELPFVLRLTDGDFQLLLRGQIDLLVEQPDDTLEVVDFKTSLQPAAGLEVYRFQLGCYALAARHFASRPVAVRCGISFLREPDVEPRWLEAPGLADAELERELVEQARALTQAQVSRSWAGRERPRCEALRCGFIYRCHPDA
jgi:ATP-dependent exoDNAse (exonuclease V) beta subunit